MKKFVAKLIIVAFVVAAVSWLLLTLVFNVTLKTEEELTRQAITLKSIEAIGNLELVKFSFSDVVEERIIRKFFNMDYLAPDSKALLVINGEAAACINLLKVRKEDISINDDLMVVTLPQPEICYAKINHENSRVYDVNLTARILNPELVQKGFQNAEKLIYEEAVKFGILEHAKINSVKVLTPLLQEISGKEIQILFYD
jgi:hypothetical protein